MKTVTWKGFKVDAVITDHGEPLTILTFMLTDGSELPFSLTSEKASHIADGLNESLSRLQQMAEAN